MNNFKNVFSLPYVRNKNVAIIYFIYFATSTWFMLGTWYAYFLDVISPEQIAVLHAAGFIAGIGLDVPTGYLADKFGRKKLLALGLLLFSVGISLFATIKNLPQMILYEIIVQSGIACISGSQEAVLHNTVSAMKLGKKSVDEVFNLIYSKCRMLVNLGLLVSGLIGGYLYRFSSKIPWLAMGVTCFIAFLLSLGLKDYQQYDDSDDSGNALSHLKDTFKVFGGKYRYMLPGIALLGGLAFISDWGVLSIGSLEAASYSPFEISVFFSIIYVISIFANHFLPAIHKKLGNFNGFIIYGLLTTLLLAASALVFVSNSTFIVIPLGAFIVLSALFMSYIVSSVSSITTERNRATALSAASFMQRGLYLLAVPFMGIAFGQEKTQLIYAGFCILTLLTLLVMLVSSRKTEQ